MPSLRAPFPSASSLLSRAWWFACDHPVPVLFLGLSGSAPWSVLLLLYLREAKEAHVVQGGAVAALWPLALGLAGVYFLRFPFRLALARWMAHAGPGGEEGIPAGRALGWALLHFPTALLYGAISTLGWILGLVAGLPFLAVFLVGFAFHRFAASESGAWQVLQEARQVPLAGIGFRLLTVTTLVCLCVFLILWTGPVYALGLAEWLLKADVASLRALFGPSSLVWVEVAAVLSLTVTELLWSLASGLLAAEWEALRGGADLALAFRSLASREQGVSP